jgi:hypothetical protein
MKKYRRLKEVASSLSAIAFRARFQSSCKILCKQLWEGNVAAGALLNQTFLSMTLQKRYTSLLLLC